MTDPVIVVEETVVEEPTPEPMVHRAGKFMFTGACTFLANDLSGKAYDAALRYVRSRRNS